MKILPLQFLNPFGEIKGLILHKKIAKNNETHKINIIILISQFSSNSLNFFLLSNTK